MYVIREGGIKFTWKHDCYGSGEERVELESVGMRDADANRKEELLYFVANQKFAMTPSQPKVGPHGTTL